jgi:hypothetical protein
MEAPYPEGDSGPAAIDGTHSHALLERCLIDNVPASHKIGMILKDHEGEFKVDADRAARVQVALDYIGPGAISEERVNPKYLAHRDDLSGTVDVQVNRGNRVWEIIDYKDGMNDAWDSAILQMEQYAIGVLAELQIPVNMEYPFDTMRLTVIQPKLALRGGQAIRSKDYAVRDLLTTVLTTIVLQAKATDDPDAPLMPGESQCKYCRAKGSCPALAGNVMKEIGVMFQPVEVGELSIQTAQKDPATMSDDQLRQIIEAAPLMRQLLDGAEAEAEARLKKGTPIAGLKLVHGKGSRSWAYPEAEMVEKLVAMGIPKSSVYVTKLVSPAQAEKLVWEKTKGGEKVKVQLSDRQLKRMAQEYVAHTTGKPTLALESDSRPAVIVDASPMFQPIPAQAESLPSWLS